jgi:hypothetical protein
MNRVFNFPLRDHDGKKWCSLAKMGIKRVDVVAYDINIQNQQYTFAGEHRHRYAIARNNVHLYFPSEDLTVNIAGVTPSSGPAAPPKRRHDKNR